MFNVYDLPKLSEYATTNNITEMKVLLCALKALKLSAKEDVDAYCNKLMDEVK